MKPDEKVFVIPPPVYPQGSLDVRWKEHYCSARENMVIRPVETRLCKDCGKDI